MNASPVIENQKEEDKDEEEEQKPLEQAANNEQT